MHTLKQSIMLYTVHYMIFFLTFVAHFGFILCLLWMILMIFVNPHLMAFKNVPEISACLLGYYILLIITNSNTSHTKQLIMAWIYYLLLLIVILTNIVITVVVLVVRNVVTVSVFGMPFWFTDSALLLCCSLSLSFVSSIIRQLALFL